MGKTKNSLGGSASPRTSRGKKRGFFAVLSVLLSLRSVRIWLYLAFLGILFAFIGVGSIFVCLLPFLFLIGLIFGLWLMADILKVAPKLWAVADREQPTPKGWDSPSCDTCLFDQLTNAEGGECFGCKKYGTRSPCEYFTPHQ